MKHKNIQGVYLVKRPNGHTGCPWVCKMKKRKWRPQIKICFILLLMFMVLGACSDSKKEGEVFEFENFTVEVKRSVYNSATRCGKLELQIKNRKNNKEKLFVTGADIVSVDKEGNEVVELDHGYQVEFGGALAKWYAEETDYRKEGQSVSLYYVNTGEKETKNLMKLQIVETVSRKVETEWEIPVKTDDETVAFTGSKIARNIVLSKYGFMEKNELGEGEPSLKGYNLIVYYKDGSKQTIMKTTEGYSSSYSVFLPKTAYASEEEKSAYFNCDFTDLKEIEMLKLGGAYYYPKGTQKAVETAMDDIYEKENALFRMETSLDRLETVSGRIAYMPLGETEVHTLQYQIDFVEPYFYEGKKMSSQDEEVYEYEGERIELDHLAKTVHYEVCKTKEKSREESLTFTNAALDPRELAEFLRKYEDQWDIGQTDRNGTLCWYMACMGGGSFDWKGTTLSSFGVEVDYETGIVIGYELYDEQGEMVEYMDNYEVWFDREVKPEMPRKDSYADYREK